MNILGTIPRREIAPIGNVFTAILVAHLNTLINQNITKQKAVTVGTGGISSEDPDALVKLKEKLESLKRSHALMKATNAAIRKGKTPDRQIPLARTGSDSVPGRGAAQAGLLWTHRIRVLFPSEQQGDAHLPRQTGGRCPFPAQKARFQVSSQQEYMGRDDVFKNSLIIRNKSKSWSY